MHVTYNRKIPQSYLAEFFVRLCYSNPYRIIAVMRMWLVCSKVLILVCGDDYCEKVSVTNQLSQSNINKFIEWCVSIIILLLFTLMTD